MPAGQQRSERDMGVEPISPAWEAGARPIYQSRSSDSGTVLGKPGHPTEPDDLSPADAARLKEVWESENSGSRPCKFDQPPPHRGACVYCGDDADGNWRAESNEARWPVRPVCRWCQEEILFGTIPPPELITSGAHHAQGISLRRVNREPGFVPEGGPPGFRHCGGDSGSWDNVVRELDANCLIVAPTRQFRGSPQVLRLPRQVDVVLTHPHRRMPQQNAQRFQIHARHARHDGACRVGVPSGIQLAVLGDTSFSTRLPEMPGQRKAIPGPAVLVSEHATFVRTSAPKPRQKPGCRPRQHNDARPTVSPRSTRFVPSECHGSCRQIHVRPRHTRQFAGTAPRPSHKEQRATERRPSEPQHGAEFVIAHRPARFALRDRDALKRVAGNQFGAASPVERRLNSGDDAPPRPVAGPFVVQVQKFRKVQWPAVHDGDVEIVGQRAEDSTPVREPLWGCARPRLAQVGVNDAAHCDDRLVRCRFARPKETNHRCGANAGVQACEAGPRENAIRQPSSVHGPHHQPRGPASNR